MRPRGLSERRALQIVGMSASSLRYQPAPDRNGELREQIVRLSSAASPLWRWNDLQTVKPAIA